MSLLRLPKIDKIGSTWERMRSALFSTDRRSLAGRKPRRLLIDSLEARQLLSVSPVSTNDVLINQNTDADQYMLTSKSVATDHNGDFVAVWTRVDHVYDARGEVVIDDATGMAMTDYNVYGRYFTDAVQRVTLPSIDQLPIDSATGQRVFYLKYNGNEIQRLTFSATTEPFNPAIDPIVGSFALWLDLNGDGVQDLDEVTPTIDYNDTMYGVSAKTYTTAPMTDTQVTMSIPTSGLDAFLYLGTPFTVSVGEEHIRVTNTFGTMWTIERGADGTTPAAHPSNATVTLLNPAATMQGALRSLGGVLADVVVEGVDGHTFNVKFGDASNGQLQPLLQFVNPVYTSGFLAAGDVTKIRTPGTTVAIPVSDDPAATAQNIEYAFLKTSQWVDIAPTFFPASINSPPSGPYLSPDSMRVALPTVSVNALSGTQFDITFTGNSAKEQQPLLSILDATGAPISNSSVTIIKQSSDEFRVNEPEPDSPTTIREDFYDQYNPQVAMGPDGDFVITWTAIVPDSQNYGSVTDIYARQFRPAAYQNDPSQIPFRADMNHDGQVDDKDPLIQSVVPSGSQFRVNTVTTNRQVNPTVGIDGEGNFTIAWSGIGQDLSFFNTISAQRFSRDGSRIGSEFVVNEDGTAGNINPFVAVAQDGVIAIAWENTNDPIYIVNPDAIYATEVRAKVYSPQGAVILEEFRVDGGGAATVAFDSADNFVIAWDVRTDKDNLTTTFEGVYAQEYQLYGANGSSNGTVILPKFRVNSANFNWNANSFWPFDQFTGQAVMDADGDITISFEGFGPDSSEIDVDRLIAQNLITAKAFGATDEELATLRVGMEKYYGLLRGEAYASMFSQFDTDPRLTSSNVLSSDNIANSKRDGQNTRVLVDLDPNAVSGSFTLKLTVPVVTVSSPTGTLSANVTITPAYRPNGGPVDPDATVGVIHNALSSLAIVGQTWWQNNKAYGQGPFEGPIAVRRVPASELAMRKSSTVPGEPENPWDPALAGINTNAYVYEVTFQGELHDEWIQLELVENSSTLKLAGTKTAEVQQMIFSSLNGAPALGQVTFSVGNFTSSAINFDSNNMAAVAAQVQAQLNIVYPGAVVTNLPGGPPWILQVSFTGNDAGIDQPLILFNVSSLAGVSYSPREVTKGAAAGANAAVPNLAYETWGEEGTMQYSISTSMTPSGNFVQVWNESPSFYDPLSLQSDAFTEEGFGLPTTNFYFREFRESTDTAGPQVSRWTAADGSFIKESEATNVAGGVKHLVVTFDEPMYDNVDHDDDAVTNPANYQLLRNGVVVPGAIVSVAYGLNKASELATQPGFSDLNITASNRWEAVITIDGNGNNLNPSGSLADPPALKDGVYTLVALAPVAPSGANPTGQSGLRDKSGNSLGRTGYVPAGQNYVRNFTLLTSDTLPGGGTLTGTEILVNQTSTAGEYNQAISQTTTTGNATEHNRRAVAMNHYGDFAVVWTSYGQDGDSNVTNPDGSLNANFDPNAATAGGVYVRLISRSNEALTGDIRVNSHTKGDQLNATIAMDADGDFVVVWASQSQDADGSWGIYGQRFNALGEKVGDEFQVNTFYTNDQISPSVAMDSAGNFVVVWATKGQSFSYFNEIRGQVFDHEGTKIGSEFRANSQTIPGTSTLPSANNLHPSISMADNGNFVVAWDCPTTELNGVIYDSVVMARLFDKFGVPIAINGNAAEFQANVGSNAFIADPQHMNRQAASGAPAGGNATIHRARNTQVAMDSAGNFIITWEAFQDNDTYSSPDSPDSYGIYFRRFGADGRPQMATDEQANFTVTALVPPPSPSYSLAQSAPFAGAQVNPSIAMDADGDYVIVWDGNGATPDAASPTNLTLLTQADPQGVFIRSFHAFNNPQDTQVPEAVSVESRANLTQAGNQKFPSVAMTPKGDTVVVWSGNGIGDTQGVFARRYVESSDTAGPIVTNWFAPDGKIIDQDSELSAVSGLQHVVIAFDEEMYDNLTHTGDAVTNPANYRLMMNGVEVPGAIVKVDYGLNMASQLGAGDLVFSAMNRYEAVLTVSSGVNGGPLLTPGSYTIEALAPVAPTTAEPEKGHSGLRDKAGNPLNYTGFETDGLDSSRKLTLLTTGNGGATTGIEFPVNATTADAQTLGAYRTVAADHSGDFAVVWTGSGVQDSNGVYVRLFRRDNTPLTDDILVNTTITGNQVNGTIAMDSDGDFVVVWASKDADGAGTWDIYAQRFDSMGRKVGSEILVNTTLNGDQVTPGVAIDDFGNFVVTWAGGGETFGYGNNIYAQTFNAAGQRISNEIVVNSQNLPGFNGRPNTAVSNPVVAISDTGRFVVTWVDVTNQVNGVITDTEIMARMFDFNGNAMTINGSNAEFQVNVGAANFLADAEHNPRVQEQPSATGDLPVLNPEITMDRFGNFIIAWQAYHDNDLTTSAGAESYGVYFRRFNANGTAVTAVDEQANFSPTNGPSAFNGLQINPSVAMTVNGGFAIVWDGNGGQPDPVKTTDTSLIHSVDTAGVWRREFQSMTNPVTAQESIGVETRANTTQGGVQQYPSIAMTPSGNSIVVWSGKGYGDNDGIFARRYESTNDTVGPMLTGFLMPDGSSVINNVQVTQSVTAIVITFDEEMLNDGSPNAATNPNNYQLLKNGVVVSGGISQVLYGLDIANQLSLQSQNYGLNVPRLNKYQAVLILDANGAGDGVQALTDGQYQVTALNSLQDKAGNPLLGTGPGPNGSRMSGVINITLPTGQETKIGGGYTSATTPNPIDGSSPLDPDHSSAKTVAADADGDYVTVWTDTTPGHQGVWAKMYKQTTTLGADGTRTTSVAPMSVINPLTGLNWVDDAILVSNAAGASDVSVARDADGDFVVTWSTWNSTTNWDVWAQRYDATGKPQGTAFRVNTYTNDVQRYSSVAMAAEGDFVITWQSNNQDGSGYGIYAQRYDADGNALGGSDEVQNLKFTNGFTGTFRLRWNDDNNSLTPDKVTGPISYSGSAAAAVANIKTALEAIGAHVEVTATNINTVAIHFVGTEGNKNLAPLWIAPADVVKTGGTSDAQIVATTTSDGFSGEFRANDTTTGDQYEPDVAISGVGNFIITWTSNGQDGDNAGQSNVYAKRFLANDAFWARSATTGSSSLPAGSGLFADSTYSTYYVAVDDPDNHLVEPGDGYDGVVQILAESSMGLGGGTGSLLKGGKYILTAAHVLWDDVTKAPIPAPYIEIDFDTPDGLVACAVEAVYINPAYDGNPFNGADIALLRLRDPAPIGVEQYDIYRGSSEIGQVGTKFGYGAIGVGATGGGEDSENTKHTGQNRWDATGSLVGVSDVLLVYDFDNGSAQNDGLGQVFGIHDLGVGINETCGDNGDSGGPTFINGLIAGVCTGGVNIAGSHDYLAGENSSFGDFGMDTRVSAYASWIDRIMTGSGSEFLVNANDLYGVDGQGVPNLVLDNMSGNQGRSSVAMNASGDFVITWTSYGHDLVGNGPGPGVNGENGVFARRYTAGFSPVTDQPGNLFASMSASDVFQVNQVAEGNQQNSRVSMDADGEFVITWESEDQDGSGYGIYARRYAKFTDVHYNMDFGNQVIPYAMVGQNPTLGANGEMGGEIGVNITKYGNQRFPGVTLDDTGDTVIVWSGNGNVQGTKSQEVFYQRFARPVDNAGPTVASISNVTTTNGATKFTHITDAKVLGLGTGQFLVTFGEDLSIQAGSSGTSSVINPANWQLTKDGKALGGGVSGVQYGLNLAYQLGLSATPSNKYEALVTFDGDAAVAGSQTLKEGSYVLTIKDFVQDRAGNRLDGEYSGMPGGNFTRAFSVAGTTSDNEEDPPAPEGDPGVNATDILVNTITTGVQNDPAVATDDDGNYVVVWVSYSGGTADIKGQRFDRYGKAKGSEFTINTTLAGSQIHPDVAMDPYGNFAVTWSGPGTGDDSGIFARLYDSFGNAIGSEFLVNVYAMNTQTMPSIGMNEDGAFVVTWTSYGQDGDLDGVYARLFNVQGTAISPEFRVNSTTAERQDNSVIAMNRNGDFVIVWDSWGQDAGSNGQWGVYGQRYTISNNAIVKVGGEFQVNTLSIDKQMEPNVAIASNGDFVVAWESMGQDGSGYGVYARRYSAAGAAKDATEFQVNVTTLNYQWKPDIAMSDDGGFVVTWASFGQDNYDVTNAASTKDYGIYARSFNANGAAKMGEYRVNATKLGDQTTPAISMTPAGNYVIAWEGPNVTGLGTDVFARVVRKATTTTNAAPTVSRMFTAEENAAARDSVLRSDERLVLSWNANDSDGVRNTSITVDGQALPYVYGPYTDPSGGANYLVALGALPAGTHLYTIKATDNLGNVSETTGAFEVVGASSNSVGPTISDITQSAPSANPVITWNVSGASAIGAVSLSINSNAVRTIYGPYSAGVNSFNFAGATGNLAAGTYAYSITVADGAGKNATRTGTFTVAPSAFNNVANNGPTISGVATAPNAAAPFISWNLVDSDDIANTSITIDGNAVTVAGPYQAANGFNYAASIASLSAGSHSYVITATDKAGKTSQAESTFTIAGPATNNGPTISGVATAPNAAAPFISWNLVDSDDIANTSITIDGNAVTVAGPYQAANGFNYAASIASLSAGSHSYVITATDKVGKTSRAESIFTIAGPATNNGPTISKIATDLSGATPIVSWNLLDADGIANTTISVAGKRVTKQYGPYPADNGSSNYSADLGTLASGTHTYVITATDRTGRTTKYTGSVTVGGQNAATQAVFSSFGKSSTSSSSAKVEWLYGG